jgi:hypothetical protein
VFRGYSRPFVGAISPPLKVLYPSNSSLGNSGELKVCFIKSRCRSRNQCERKRLRLKRCKRPRWSNFPRVGTLGKSITSTLILYEQVLPEKSLGALRKAEKTKPRSPDLIGQLHIQRHTLREIVAQAKETDDEEVICNLAAWRNEDRQGATYLCVELSPWFRRRRQQSSKSDVFSDLFEGEEE